MNLFKKQAFANITWGEILVVFALGLIAAIVAFRKVIFVGNEFDTLLYLNTAQFTDANSAILNRYAHIYLQKLFMVFVPQPLEAVKALWAFEIFGTCVLVYLCAKALNLKNNFLVGVFAVLFFLAQRKLYATAGAPLIEFTLMFFLCAGILLYIIYLNERKPSLWLLFAIGFVQFLMMKTKETGIIFAPLVLAAIFLSGKKWGQRRTGLLWTIGGGVVGLGLFMLLDGIFVHDALFSLRPENWRHLLQFNLTLVYDERSPLNWYDVILATALALPVVFSLMTIDRDSKEEYDWARRLVWVLPILLVVFLSFTMYRAAFPMNFRYVYPAFALFAISGAQYLQLRGKGEVGLAVKLLLGSIGAAALLYAFVYPYVASQPFRWTESGFFTNVMASLLVSAIFLALLIPRSIKINRELLLVPMLGILFITPILNIPAELAVTRARAENVIAPYTAYQDFITRPTGARVFFSAAAYQEYAMLGRDSGSTKYLFEAYFNTGIPPVTFSERPQDLFLAEYDYAFLTRDELVAADLQDDLTAAGYVIHDDPSIPVVLISR